MASANPNTVIRKSPIHGRGLFAARAIAEGTLIGVAEGEPTMEDGPHVLWFVDDDGSEEGLLVSNEMRWINHDDEANATFDGPDLIALRPIAKGDEITFAYSSPLDELEAAAG